MKLRYITAFVLGVAFAPAMGVAQDSQTLADVRQELTMLYTEVQKLRRELSTTGGAGVNTAGASVLDRVSAMESELSRLTAKSEEMENRINRIVADGTSRIGDLEFRLVELEGGDISALGETSTLGGDGQTAVAAPLTAPATPTDQASLAVGEAADFERAQEALASSDFRTAADLFATFNQTYPGGPLAAEADLRRGDALDKLGDTKEAARAYLASFSTDPEGALAPQALYELGRTLGVLGQTQEACTTLGEVGLRFPQSTAASQAQDQRRNIGCT
ncbi:Tetratricopeptide TPR 2 [Sulfitobacter noctilucicola]|uniref:Cell division coordinator CpoB n=1 Tax=Sulfitobacter noctilucicola TaxID=1342301 RepID=A0A7W6M963_9RHOB|nr:tol-pal system protein YbgF [Sulfitobacter noctilucicola]KIN63801.1 Tetratricopeptide TPR 2 [Sulfitobacter noctilucicola]MBB4174689.1 tol-pal system protein YbgF [Sulfitobacter noctilucicola]